LTFACKKLTNKKQDLTPFVLTNKKQDLTPFVQINNAIRAYSKINCSEATHLIPCIITNAKIWIIDYKDPQKPNVKNYKWALHKVKLDPLLKLEKREGKEPFSFTIPVVNIRFLEEFIRRSQLIQDGKIEVGPEFVP
jgi:hypothetical protein